MYARLFFMHTSPAACLAGKASAACVKRRRFLLPPTTGRLLFADLIDSFLSCLGTEKDKKVSCGGTEDVDMILS